MEDVYIRGTGVKTPPGMFPWDAACLINSTCIVRGATEVGAMALAAAILTLCQGHAVLDIVIVSATPRTEEGVMVGVVGPGVVEEVTGVGNLVVGHLFKGRGAIDDAGGNAVIGISLGQGLGAFKVLHCDVS